MESDKPRKKPGPAPKPASEKAEQLTIRLSPKMKLGLDLLLRAQRGRTLSQVVEWALLRAMNSVQVGFDPRTTVGTVLDKLWEQGRDSEWIRISLMQFHAPELLDFVEKSIFESLMFSEEAGGLSEEEIARATVDGKTDFAVANTYAARVSKAISILVHRNWDHIKQEVAARDVAGKDPRAADYWALLGLPGKPKNIEALEAAAGIEK